MTENFEDIRDEDEGEEENFSDAFTEMDNALSGVPDMHAVIHFAETYRQALEIARGRQPNFVLIDVDREITEVAALLRSFYLDSETLLAQIISEGQQTGVFRRNLDPRVGAWELIRTALGYTLTLPLAIPLYQEPDYLPRAIDCLLHCLLKTDV